MSYYLLNGHTPVPATLDEWAAAIESRRFGEDVWRVDHTSLFDTCTVSTVFLGLDHSLGRPGDPPELFETMVFGSGTDLDEDAYRTSTWDDAQRMHNVVVDAVRNAVTARLARPDPTC